MLDLVVELLQEYGPIGALAALLLYAVQELRERLRELTDKLIESEQTHNKDFTDLLKSNIEVMARLTGYIKALKESVDRVEDKVDED